MRIKMKVMVGSFIWFDESEISMDLKDDQWHEMYCVMDFSFTYEFYK